MQINLQKNNKKLETKAGIIKDELFNSSIWRQFKIMINEDSCINNHKTFKSII